MTLAGATWFVTGASAGLGKATVAKVLARGGNAVAAMRDPDFYLLWGQLRPVVTGFKAVRNLVDGHFDNVRYGLSRWHRRQGLLRIADLLDRLGD